MDIAIFKNETETANNSTYNYNTVQVETRTIDITVVTGRFNYINVTVNNAMQRAWKGLGKRFETIAEALENYKDPKIKAALNYVQYK